MEPEDVKEPRLSEVGANHYEGGLQNGQERSELEREWEFLYYNYDQGSVEGRSVKEG